MAATIVKRELCTSSQWPKSFSMNDTQIQWEFRHKMLKDRWRKSKSSKTCLPPTPTSQINQRRKNDVHTEGSFIMAAQKCNNFTKISNKKNLYINLLLYCFHCQKVFSKQGMGLFLSSSLINAKCLDTS